jgi:hypothetical protein
VYGDGVAWEDQDVQAQETQGIGKQTGAWRKRAGEEPGQGEGFPGGRPEGEGEEPWGRSEGEQRIWKREKGGHRAKADVQRRKGVTGGLLLESSSKNTGYF